MICAIARRLGPLHAGRDLPGWVGAIVDRHAAGCAACASELRSLGGARAALGQLAVAERRIDADREARRAPDPLGENFWLAIRRDLRTEGLVARPGEAPDAVRARSKEVARASGRLGHAPETPWVEGLALRGLAAAAAAVLAAVLFIPGQGPATPAPTGEGTVALRPVGELTPVRPVPSRAPVDIAARGGALRGVPAVPAAFVVPAAATGWIEETRSFAPAEVRFGLEGWGSQDGERPNGRHLTPGARTPQTKRDIEDGTLSF